MAFEACKGRGVINLYRWSAKDGQVCGARAEIDAHEVFLAPKLLKMLFECVFLHSSSASGHHCVLALMHHQGLTRPLLS